MIANWSGEKSLKPSRIVERGVRWGEGNINFDFLVRLSFHPRDLEFGFGFDLTC